MVMDICTFSSPNSIFVYSNQWHHLLDYYSQMIPIQMVSPWATYPKTIANQGKISSDISPLQKSYTV